MTPNAIQVAIDILRELGLEEQARWIEHPDATRRLLADGTCVDRSRSGAGWYCTGCAAHHMGPHERDCAIMAAYRMLKDPRAQLLDVDEAHSVANDIEGARKRELAEAQDRARIRANIDTLSDAEVVERIDGGEPSSGSPHDFIRWGVTNGFWTEERAQRMLAAFPDKPGALPRRSYPPSWRGRIEQAEGFANAGLITPGQVADVLR